jgi:hypothetical protein
LPIRRRCRKSIWSSWSRRERSSWWCTGISKNIWDISCESKFI